MKLGTIRIIDQVVTSRLQDDDDGRPLSDDDGDGQTLRSPFVALLLVAL